MPLAPKEGASPSFRPSVAPIIALFGALVAVFCFGADWGLPSPRRQRLLQLLRRESPAWVLTNESLRQDYVEARWATQDVHSLASLQLAEPTATSTSGGVEMDQQAKYVALRMFALSSSAIDEVGLLQGLQRMYRSRNLLDPKGYTYGLGFLAPVGASLAVGRLFGRVSTEVLPRHILDDPTPHRALYIIPRILSGLSVATGALLLSIGVAHRTKSWAQGLVTAAAVIVSPLATYYARVSKPYALVFAASCVMLLLLHSWAKTRRRRTLLLASAVSGFASGAHITCAPLLALPVLSLCLTFQDRTFWEQPWRTILLVMGPAIALLALLNPWILFNLPGFIDTVREHSHQGHTGFGFLPLTEMFSTVSHFLITGLGLPTALLVLLGLPLAWKIGTPVDRAALLVAVLGTAFTLAYFHFYRLGFFLLPLWLWPTIPAFLSPRGPAEDRRRLLKLALVGLCLVIGFSTLMEDLIAIHYNRMERSERETEEAVAQLPPPRSVGLVGPNPRAYRPTFLVAFPILGVTTNIYPSLASALSAAQDDLLLVRVGSRLPSHTVKPYRIVATLGTEESDVHRALCLGGTRGLSHAEWFDRTLLLALDSPTETPQ